MLVEIIEVLSPALSALAGGLFAVLGGSIAERKIDKNRNRDFLRDKIQEIYSLTIETEEWVQQETVKINQYVAHGSKLELENLKSKSKHIRMLLKLYFKDSASLCEDLDKFEKLFYDGMGLAYSAPAEFNKPEHQQVIMDSSVLYFIALSKIRDYLETEIAKITKIS
ncbi:MAG: hypothetical protein WAW61_05875 [Methylococcaceae bacterium]